MKKFVLSKKYWIIGLVLIAAVSVWFLTRSSSGVPEGIEIAAVTKGEVSEVISETGFVTPIEEVDLAFESGGRVTEILVEEGSKVNAGDVLVKLDASAQSAALSSAYAKLEAEQVRLEELLIGADQTSLAVTGSSVEAAKTTFENAKRNLAEVTQQQDQLVLNAEKTLRSSDLQAYLTNGERENSGDSYTAPTISGTYASEEDGVYALELYSSGSPSGSSFRVTGLESQTQSVSSVNPVALGTRGLYIQFPENFASRTAWEVPVPNIRSSSYLTNLNTYNAVVNARNVAIATAENAVGAAEAALNQSNSQYTQVSGSARDEKITAQRALVRQMQAAVEVAQVAHNNTVITAPFEGVVTSVHTVAGQIVSPTAPIVSLISGSNFELVVNVSESDIQQVDLGDTAIVRLDAYDDISFNAQVTRIAPNAVIVDGVRIFEIQLQFTEENELIRSGLSADIDISTATRTDVVAVPSRAVVENADGKFVRTLIQNTIEYIPVQVGLRGSNGMTEIVSGLQEGQSIIHFADRSVLEKLESN